MNATKIGPAFGPGAPIHWESPHAVFQLARAAEDPIAYRALVERARELCVLRLWASDLIVCDRAALGAAPSSRRFLWGIGETGTTLVWLDPPSGLAGWQVHAWERVNEVSRPRAESLIRTILDMRPHLHVWDGVSLSSCDADRAVALLVGEGDAP